MWNALRLSTIGLKCTAQTYISEMLLMHHESEEFLIVSHISYLLATATALMPGGSVTYAINITSVECLTVIQNTQNVKIFIQKVVSNT
jgi:hypothetical protein